VHPVGSCYTDISRCTVNKTLNNLFIKVLDTWTDYRFFFSPFLQWPCS